MITMPDIVDDDGNIWLHGLEGVSIPLEAEDPLEDASTWTVMFRTASGFSKAFVTDPGLSRGLILRLSETEADAFPLLPLGARAEDGMQFAFIDETAPGAPQMILQAYISRYGFE
jgi:hypothetical protein